MDRWVGKVAVITGAGSGIGSAVAVDLAKAGVIAIGLDRCPERVKKLISKVPPTETGTLHALECDISKEEDVRKTFALIETQFGGIDIMINNAGILRPTTLLSKDNSEPIRKTIDTNLLGMVWCTREAFQSMKKREVDGHIILINSITGHNVPPAGPMPSLNIYPCTKFAVTALTEVLRQELQTEGTTKTKITVWF